MVQRVSTVAFEGIEARAVDVQVQVAPGLPAFAKAGRQCQFDPYCYGKDLGPIRSTGPQSVPMGRPGFEIVGFKGRPPPDLRQQCA